VSASGLPDPAAYLARTTVMGAGDWSDARVGEAADEGVLVAGPERVLAGTGIAATLPLPRGLDDPHALRAVTKWLRAVEHEATPQATTSRARATGRAGPVALGGFPFARAAPTSLIVPSVTWCKERDGSVWRVEVRRRDDPGGPVWPDAPPAPRPAARDLPRTHGEVSLLQVPHPAAYADAVGRALADIAAGRVRKVVLGRGVRLRTPCAVAPSRVLQALWGAEGTFSPFSIPVPSGRLVGASPELVVARYGHTVRSHAFAGTVALRGAGDAELAHLAASAKDRAEHRLVVEEIAAALDPLCSALAVPAEPTPVRLRTDARLGTLIEGTLRPGRADLLGPDGTAGGAGTAVLALLARLHPTPAVAGVPRDAATAEIAALEPAGRGYWAGAVGWTDAWGDGEWVLGIRSAELDGAAALVRAGAGIVEGSDPRRELDETTVKLRPVLDALWPGSSALL